MMKHGKSRQTRSALIDSSVIGSAEISDKLALLVTTYPLVESILFYLLIY